MGRLTFKIVVRFEPIMIAGICVYELGGLAGLWRPWTHVFRDHPWTFLAFVTWLMWHTWLKVEEELEAMEA